jgi:hypothetical protein
MTNQEYYGLNDIGSRMWQMLIELQSIEEVTKRLCATYDVAEATLRADLESLVRDLLKAGLLKVV